jgi:hypothetical protein
MRRDHQIIVAVEKQCVLHVYLCVWVFAWACSLTYPACTAHALYCIVICGLSGATIRFGVINCTIFEKKILNLKCAFTFSLQVLSQTFLILRRLWRDIAINVETSSCKMSCRIVIKFDFFEGFLKNSNIIFYKNPSSEILVATCRRTDGRTDRRTDMKLLVTSRSLANAPKNTQSSVKGPQ